MSGQYLRPPLTAHEVEDKIQETLDDLESLVEDYAEIAKHAAVADVDFKRAHASTLLAVIAQPPKDAEGKPRRITADERAAIVELNVNDLRRDAAIAGAAREHGREAMNTHRTRLEALRTLAANVRAVTTDRFG